MTRCRTVIIGLGVTGRSCIRHLQGDDLLVLDTRSDDSLLADLPTHPALECRLGMQSHEFSDADRVLVSPGMALDHPLLADALRRGLPIQSDIELFFDAAEAPVFAITGTNGKSTVTAMTAALLAAEGYRVQVGGNLGEPALDLLAGEPDYYVLELSSFQIERLRDVALAGATVLNVTEDHIDRHGDIDTYAGVKTRLYRRAAVCAFNRADARSRPGVEVPGRRTSFGLDAPGMGEWGRRRQHGELWFARGDAALLPVASLRLAGLHNQENFLAACAVLDDLTLSAGALDRVAHDFQALPHRCETVAEKRGVRFVNDSKATNVGATIAAVQGIAPTLGEGGRIVLLAGGDGKGADFGPLRALAGSLRAVVLYGRDAGRLRDALDGAVPLIDADGFQAAVLSAASEARCGDCVLLAPACASLDMFANYGERGRRFVSLVGELPV
ncbi:MAG: UDP-N-acetylmuramoyl-L-alanine--D-glutamate ligase [Pseudomonadales bacterium]|nr:UDP-N-acetylmuramoyl-L-alanine--D-glutamate ligase [Pseudomonadales bacterium]MCP5185353.1 UDP-N-acetylmuramoyl-L-alanine--D-glutamate ligase [Pseudomonadales bacterium]